MWVRLSPPSGSRTKIGLGRKTIFNIQRKEQTTEHGFFCLFVLVEMFTNHSHAY